ncbi:MAG TPA: FUN14 domain-containing protein [Candidatus Sulfotelmatobacter sp.]|jgi:uncharacterized membrane protein (Fun14 family)|nr:FUN14 domain-containing protein [Candidatus Sulfotelmatobacter sp.]
MSEIITPLVYQLGLGGIGGFVAGFAVKKITKLFIIIVGLFVAALLYLSVKGIININYTALWNTIANGLGVAGAAAGWIVSIVSLIPFAGSFGVGFLLGFKVG